MIWGKYNNKVSYCHLLTLDFKCMTIALGGPGYQHNSHVPHTWRHTLSQTAAKASSPDSCAAMSVERALDPCRSSFNRRSPGFKAVQVHPFSKVNTETYSFCRWPGHSSPKGPHCMVHICAGKQRNYRGSAVWASCEPRHHSEGLLLANCMWDGKKGRVD